MREGDAPKPTQEQKECSAMTTEELPHRLIKMFAFRGDTVLDPFMGSGTTSLAAKNLERNSVGYEINLEFIEIAKQKLNTRQPDFMGTEYEFLHDTLNGDVAAAIEQLPYQFKDPHKLDKKTDPRKLTFGSRIEKESEAEREEFFTVKEILSPEKVRLSNGLTVKLIGIKSELFTHDKAIGYLTEKIKGKRIFLKYDKLKNDEENVLLCYLYLENKTFVNAHLIKSGLVGIDSSYEYKQKVKFLDMGELVQDISPIVEQSQLLV